MFIKIYTFIIIYSIFLLPVFPEEKEKKYGFNILGYGALFVNADLLPISLYGDIAYKRSYLEVLGVNYPLNTKLRFLNFEVEGLAGKHFGRMKHFEFDGVFLARAGNLFNLPMSIAFGQGLSWASQNPILENQQKGFDIKRGTFSIYDVESRQLLNFLVIEADFGFPFIKYFPRIFVRLHHRSGIWGTYCPADPPCGSNFLSYGIKISI
jgi:hypothetical protein